MKHITVWHRMPDGTTKRIGRLPFFLEVGREILVEVDKFQIVPRWYAPCWQPYDRDSIVFAPMGLHWMIQLGRKLYYAVRMQLPPEARELRRLRREVNLLRTLVNELEDKNASTQT